ncbi:rhodanese-like domain-containing protein [Candidatus Peregrinibacteria bacterium]|nr:rhodanese-like domain-containing protein [Candidatus Peregrinibacteria bacterium]
MALAEDAIGNLKIASSEVRTLSAPKVKIIETATAATPLPPKVPRRRIVENDIQEDETFFEKNKNLNLAVSNEEFQQITRDNPQAYVLDAREDEEFEIGYFPGSNHMRFADLLAGEWIRLPTDKVVYVFCWSGIRGKEVAEFLRSKKILARYVENGADKWVAFGGTWTGGIKFLSKYTEDRYKVVFTLEELRQHMADGAFIVDSRIKAKYDAWHISDSINIPIIYTPSVRIEELLAKVPSGKKVITICDDFISCFDAKVTGVKLEKKGHEFLGRYNKPWEYRAAQ